MIRRHALTLLPTLCLHMAAQAGEYPDRMIRIINPFPGGPTDAVARLVAKILYDKLRQTCIVENKVGAGGVTALDYVSKSPPDGYTLLLATSSTHLYQAATKKSLPYDVLRDFTPLMIPGQSTFIIVVRAESSIKSFDDLLKQAKAKPGALTFGSPGMGTGSHIAGEIFATSAGVKMLHVPYRGASNAITELIGGQIDVMFDSPSNSGPHIRDGRLRALATMGQKRWSNLPDVPTATELGYPDMQLAAWPALFSPPNLPAPIQTQLIDALSTIASDPQAKIYFETAGYPITPIFGSDAAALMSTQLISLRAALKKANISPID